MKILILSTSNPYRTAGIVAFDLYKGLSSISGNEVKILVREWNKFPDKNIIAFESRFTHFKKRVFRKLRKILTRLRLIKPRIKITNRDYCVYDYDQTITYYSTKAILRKIKFMPNTIIVLFMQNFLSFKNLMELNIITKAPIFLYMMDMASMTGICHFAWDCRSYYEKCGNCPALYSEKANDQSNINWEFKKKYIDKTNLTAIVGTEYQYQQLMKSSLFEAKRKEKILLSIDPNIFCPGDKKQAANDLGLPANKKIIFFGTGNIVSKRKGYKELITALSVLRQMYNNPSDIHLVIVGGGTDDLENNLPFDYTLIGRLNHNELVKVFQAAELFLCPSIEDSGPMMINQSIMCGTPVVAFEMGVALDLVITAKTGYRAKLRDTEDFAKGIKYILEMDEIVYNKIFTNCRELALDQYTQLKQVESFKRLLKKSAQYDN